MKRNTISSDLICSECGQLMTIPRFKNRQREKYHIKDLYCVTCGKVTKFIEIRDQNLCKKELEMKPNRTEQEEFLYFLLQKNMEKCFENEQSGILKKVW